MAQFNHDIFGPYVKALRRWFSDNQKRLLGEGYTPSQTRDAIGLYMRLCDATTSEYFSNRAALFSEEPARQRFVQDITKLQRNVLETGVIEGISEDFSMTREEAIAQCGRADAAFSERPDLERLLADANYSFFTGKTMATAKDLLKLDLNSFYTEGMPHLTASNGAIGYSVKEYLLERAEAGENAFTITDLGSGSGATLAGILLGLAEADMQLRGKVKVMFKSIEGCNVFYNLLRSEMIPAIETKAREFQNIELKVCLQYGDIQTNLMHDETEGTAMYSANYVLHRLGDSVKRSVCRRIGEQVAGRDAAFFAADIYRNTSEMPNRRYFNFSLNGPLNPGNDVGLMEALMAENGFGKILSDKNMGQFKGLPPAIVNACNIAKGKEQGFLIAGYKKAQ